MQNNFCQKWMLSELVTLSQYIPTVVVNDFKQ